MQAVSLISTPRALAETFAAMRELGITDRRLFDEILRETLAQNKDYLAVWSVWEPNALDGRDRDFANSPGHDQSGRFIPCWNRGGGSIHVEPNLGYDVPGYGDWYLVPHARQADMVIDPYEFPFAGRPEFITSQVAPIMFRGACVGVAGVDIAVDDLENPDAEHLEETLHRCFIFLDHTGAVEYWSARTRTLLARYTGAPMTDELPASIAGHVLRLRKALSAELPPLRRGGSVLRLKFAQHPHHRGFLIVAEEEAAPAPEASLTPREREVLEWLGQGKANGEIGIILGISHHTVKRHVERIFDKLGVENRFAAALIGLGEA